MERNIDADVVQNETETVSDDDDFVVVDEEGKIVEAAAEGSCLMAEALLEMARAETGEDYIILEPYVPDFDVASVQAKAATFFEMNDARQTAEARNQSTSHSGEVNALENDGEYFEEDFPFMGSRDLTDPDDWKLETILKRRLNKEKEGGLWIYLCKWKGHEEPTWETREVMEDAGWIAEVDAFDAKGKLGDENGPRLSKPTAAELEDAAKLESFFGATPVQVAKAITTPPCGGGKSSIFTIMRYCRMNAALATPFLKRWEACQDTHVPKIVFHGTRAENFTSIYENGLVIGGTKNVKIVNGAVHGSGVYTASTHYTPMGYSDTSNALIVCIGLVPIDEKWPTVYRTSSNYLIFREAADVYPMWLVQFAGACSAMSLISTSSFIKMSMQSFGASPYDWKATKSYPVPDSKKQPLSEEEQHTVDRALKVLLDGKGNIKKASLKGQPRRIKELLARAKATHDRK